MSLRVKIALGVTFIVVLLTGGFTYQSVRRQSHTMRNELQIRGRALLENAAEGFRVHLHLGDLKPVLERLPRIEREEDVVFVILLDAGGKPLGWEPLRKGPAAGGAAWEACRGYASAVSAPRDPEKKLVEVRPMEWERRMIYRFSAALVARVEEPDPQDPFAPRRERPKLLGTLHLGMSTSRTDMEIKGMVLRSLGIGAAVLLASLLLLAFVIEVIVRPIRVMTEAAGRIAAGDLTQRVGLRGKGEIAKLGASFDEMTEKLRGSREELLRANEELRLWSEKLEKEVENRTHELQEANRDLTLAISVKEDFLRAVSHDLNGPLVNIAGICGMITRKYAEQLDGGVKDRLGRIQRNVEKLSDLIGDLLELSRIKSRRLPFSRVKVGDLVGEVRSLFEFQLEERGVEFLVQDGMPELYCEKTRIKQIFHNLVDNGIKYMGERDRPRIQVGFREEEDAFRFWVEDNGSGIAPEDRKILFHVFRRGRNREVQKTPGRGIGLSLIKQIVETYGGQVGVESAVGEGTTFWFTLAKGACKEGPADDRGDGEDEDPSRR